MLEDSAPVEASHAKDELEEEQLPAVSAAVPGEDKQRQALQEGVDTAEEEQQQPPRQRLVPQSKLEAHTSPGDQRRQVPKKGRQAEQLRAAEEGEQQ